MHDWGHKDWAIFILAGALFVIFVSAATGSY